MLRWERIVFVMVWLLSGTALLAQEVIPLWDDQMPNSRGTAVPEVISNERVRSVAVPTLTAFYPDSDPKSPTSVIICPGGGYKHLAIDKEGYQVAKWLNTKGVSAFVLKYRLPQSPDVITPHLVALQDLQRAIKLVRDRSNEWELRADRIGVLGFSAGGHLAATAGTLHDRDYSLNGDDLDSVSCRPDFMVLIYAGLSVDRPVLLGDMADADLVNLFSPILQTNFRTPPAFMVYCADDKTAPAEDGIRLHKALGINRVRSELHIFQSGGHGFGLGDESMPVGSWPELLYYWLKDGHLVEKN